MYLFIIIFLMGNNMGGIMMKKVTDVLHTLPIGCGFLCKFMSIYKIVCSHKVSSGAVITGQTSLACVKKNKTSEVTAMHCFE